MKNRSKILGLILTTALLAVILAVGVFAVEEGYTQLATGTCFTGSTVTWTVYENSVGEQLLEFTGKGALKVIDLDNDGAYVQPKYNASVALRYDLYVPWAAYVPDITKIIVGDGIYAIDPYAFSIHKYVQTVELGKDVISLGNKAFWGCNALQTMYRSGTEPKVGTLDLTGITYLGDQLFDSCKAFSSIILPTEGSYTLKNRFIYDNTSLTSLYIPAACTKVEAEAITWCTKLTSIAFESNETVVADGAFANNELIPTTYTPSTVTVKVAGKDDITVSTAYMSNLLQVGDTTYVVYTDSSYTTLYPNTIITGATTVYAKMLFDFVGYEVRVEDYNGLRFIYDYNPYAFSGLNGYTVSMGVLGAQYYGVDPILNHAYYADLLNDTQLIVDGEFATTAKFISYDSDSYRFAHTAVGYGDKDGGAVVPSRVATELLSRAYVILKNASGEETVLYTPQYKNDLNNACDATKTAGASVLTDDQMAFVQTLLDLDADPNEIYTKAEALAYLTEVYSNGNYILSGQHLYSDTPETVKETLQKVYANSGELPAVLSYDAAKGYRSYKDSADKDAIIADLVDQFKQYAKQGGLITFCAHLTNPADPTLEYNGSFTDWTNLWSYETFKDEIDGIVEIMLAMKEAGIPIFWRPYHEMNMINADSKFWWSYLDSSVFTTLWEETYNYFVTDNGLDNLIWIYSPKMAPQQRGILSSEDPDRPMAYYYPGDAYVDVTALDWYHGSSLTHNDLTWAGGYDSLVNKGKPVVYGEFGPNDGLLNADASQSYNGSDALETLKELKGDGWKMGWVVFWSTNKTNWMSLEDMYEADTFMADSLIYTLEESKAAFFD